MMKKAVMGTTLAVFALAPALAWSDCEYHNQSAMAQMASAKPAENASSVKTNALHATPATAKAEQGNTVKKVTAKAAPPKVKPEATAVVAKNN